MGESGKKSLKAVRDRISQLLAKDMSAEEICKVMKEEGATTSVGTPITPGYVFQVSHLLKRQSTSSVDYRDEIRNIENSILTANKIPVAKRLEFLKNLRAL